MTISFAVNNSNNIVTNSNDCHLIPFGYNCAASLACNFANLRKFALPFDWVSPLPPDVIQNILENKLTDFIPDVRNGIFTNKYNCEFPHFNKNTEEGISAYERRITRFNDIMNDSKKKYFICVNEYYLYSNTHRLPEWIHKNFTDMLNLDCYLKTKYVNMDYVIVYFSYTHHTIPVNHNIINIIIHSSQLFDKIADSPFEEVRYYCGRLLTSIFNTKMGAMYYTDDIFINEVENS